MNKDFAKARKMVEDYFETAGTSVIIAVVGPNGSGKSSTVNALGLLENPCFQWDGVPLVVNADLAARQIKQKEPNLDVDALNKKAFDLTEKIKEKVVKSKRSFILDTVGSHPSRVEYLERAKAAGYGVGVLFIATESPEINIGRIKHRVQCGGHTVPDAKVRSRYQNVMNLFMDYLNVADVFLAVDNSRDSNDAQSQSARPLLEKTADGRIVELEAFNEVSWIGRVYRPKDVRLSLLHNG